MFVGNGSVVVPLNFAEMLKPNRAENVSRFVTNSSALTAPGASNTAATSTDLVTFVLFMRVFIGRQGLAMTR